jgi:hypothetical protein
MPDDLEEPAMISLLDGPQRRPGDDDEEDWLALVALTALALAAVVALRRLRGAR